MLEWLSAREPIIVFLFLFFSALFESIFPPYPSDAFVLVFAFIAGQGYFNPYLIYLFTVLGSISGIMLIYLIGKSKGDALIRLFSRSFLAKIFPAKLIDKAKQKFSKRGDLIILLNRFLPGMRAPICFTAGIVNIDGKKVFAYSLISVILWNVFLVMVGFYVGATWQEASKFLRDYNIIVTLIIILILVFFTIIYFRKRQKI